MNSTITIGSAKQIAWATQIQAERITTVDTLLAALDTITPNDEKDAAGFAEVRRVLEAQRDADAQHIDARYFIDNRDNGYAFGAAMLAQMATPDAAARRLRMTADYQNGTRNA